jgi:SprT protein
MASRQRNGRQSSKQIVQECLDKVQDRNAEVKLAFPEIVYDLKGRTAGRANGEKIRLNADLLNGKYREDMLNQTVPHEVAHSIQFQLFPRSQPHGREWRVIMYILGKPATRCHNYDTKPARVTKRPYEYRCNCQTHHLTEYKHIKIQSGAKYICKRCKGELR